MDGGQEGDAAGDPEATDPDGGAPMEAGASADAAAIDSACGSLATVGNCGACGQACDTSTGSPSCNAGVCSYVCDSDRQDCNATTVPDKDGCECAGTACCNMSCQTAHASGLSTIPTYYDCSAAGNTTQQQAMAACMETGGSGCTATSTTCGGIFGFGGMQSNAVCGTVSGNCSCWIYSGVNAGQVHAGNTGCALGCASGVAWD